MHDIFFVIFLFGDKTVARKIVVTSGKGGVGKTTLTANIGRALSDLGARVVLIDVDFGLNNLDVVLGVENKIVYDVCDIIEGRCRTKQALIQDLEKKNLYILPSGNLNSATNITGQQIKLIINGIDSIFDYILIDCPAGIDIGFHRAVSCSDEAIVVATPALTSLRDADKVITVLRSYKLERIRLVVNRVRGDLIMSDKMMMPSDIRDLLKTELLGVLPEEDEVFLSGGYSLSRYSDSHKAYKILANNILKNTSRIYDVTGKYSGFFGSIRRSIKRGI